MSSSISLTDLDVRPVTGRMGAEITGVDLSTDLDDAVVAEIRATLVRHKVVFFRQQFDLDADGQIRFARRFGELTTAHPTVPSLEDQPFILDLDYSRTGARANHWHTDVTFVDRPPLGSVLRAVVIPPYGGDTLWGNAVSAYEALPDRLRDLADGLRAVHSNSYDYANAMRNPGQDASSPPGADLRRPHPADYASQFTSIDFQTEHPVVRVHPESGERGLFIGGFVRSIRGLSSQEGGDVLRTLQSYVVSPEHTVRWRWQPGDVAFWDNRATQHYAVADYGDLPRRVQRVTIAGDLPVGVDGRPSVAITGDSSAYTPVRA